MALPQAEPGDFHDRSRYTPAAAHHLRRVADVTLRDRLLASGMAEVAERRRGRLPRTVVLRLRPSLDGGDQRSRAKREGTLPKVEELRSLVDAIVQHETIAFAEMSGRQNAILEDARSRIAHVDGEELEDLMRALRSNMRTPAQLRTAARSKAFAELALRRDLPARGFLSMLRVDYDEAFEPLAPIVDERALLRAKSRAEWDDVLTSVLTRSWQSSRDIAAQLGRTHDTVIGRLKDMMQRGIVERRVDTLAAPIKAKKPKKPGRPRKGTNTAKYASRFRLTASADDPL